MFKLLPMRLPLKEYQRNKKTTLKRILKWFFLGIVVPPGFEPGTT